MPCRRRTEMPADSYEGRHSRARRRSGPAGGGWRGSAVRRRERPRRLAPLGEEASRCIEAIRQKYPEDSDALARSAGSARNGWLTERKLLANWWRSDLVDGVVPAGPLIVHDLACQDVRLTREQPGRRPQFHKLFDHLPVWTGPVRLQEFSGCVEVRGLGRTRTYRPHL